MLFGEFAVEVHSQLNRFTVYGTFKLKTGLRTGQGLEHFLKLNAGKGKNYTIQNVTSFGEKNLIEVVILKETLPNGVTRLQLPREAWHNQISFGNARFAIDTQKWKGIKTLWPSNFTISDLQKQQSML